MPARRLGECLIRPSLWTRMQPSPCSQRLTRATPSWTAHRSTSSTSPRAPQQSKEENEQPEFEQRQQPRPPPRRPSQSETSQAIDWLFSGMSSNSNAPPPISPPAPPSSSDEVRAARSDHIFGAEFSPAGRSRSRRMPSLNFDSMALPDSLLDASQSNRRNEAAALTLQQEETFANYPRLNPTYGRTVDLDSSRGRDLVRGIGMLGSLVTRNKIRSDFAKQKFHERGGLKRKRLNSERWRARFKVGFTQITSRVTELTRKGW